MELFSVSYVLITIGDYPLSLIELVGTLLYFASVWLIARRSIWTWPVGILSVLLYAVIFYQIQLYADLIEQGYYLVISIVGWVSWHRVSHPSRPTGSAQLVQAPVQTQVPVHWSSKRALVLVPLVCIGATAGLGLVLTQIHLWLPTLFTLPASLPLLDTLTTVLSVCAMYLMTRRKKESWIYWIVVNLISIGLYWYKDVRFIAIQYLVLLGMAVFGLLKWNPSGSPAKPRVEPSS